MKNADFLSPQDDSIMGQTQILLAHVSVFDTQFPDDEARLKLLRFAYYSDGVVPCSRCGSRDTTMIRGGRVAHCKCCNTKTWFLADTFFDHVKRLRAWLLAIFLKGSGVAICGNQLHEIAKISPDTGWKIIHKLDMVAFDEMDKESNSIALCSASFIAAFIKRSSETPSREHPVVEQAEMERIEAETLTNKPDDALTGAQRTEHLSGDQKAVLEMLSTDQVHIDEVCVALSLPVAKAGSLIMILELEGLAKSLPGGFVVSTAGADKGRNDSSLEAPCIGSNIRIPAIIDYICGVFHGISRKYLQLYLAGYWCYIDRGRWSFDSLLSACVRSEWIGDAAVRRFLSPLKVKAMPTVCPL